MTRLDQEPSTGGILIIDDEELVRRTMRAILEAGYTVFEAVSGAEGFELFSRSHDRISAALLDLNMGLLGGYEVCRQIRGISSGCVCGDFERLRESRRYAAVRG